MAEVDEGEGGGGGEADLALRPYQEEMLAQALEDNVCGVVGSTSSRDGSCRRHTFDFCCCFAGNHLSQNR